jgi:eukaryotic-like serine/threonine-protein kinase
MDPVSGVAEPESGSIGAPPYLSPEEARFERRDGRSDLFSVGCVLYEMVTGKMPFRSDSVAKLLLNIVSAEPDLWPISHGPEWERLRGVITRALQKKPEDRYPDASAMRTDLELALKELGKTADWSPPPSGSPAAPQFH